MYTSPPSRQRPITVATLLLLGACATFAVMNSYDADHTAVHRYEEMKEVANPATTTMTQDTNNDELVEIQSEDDIDHKRKAQQSALLGVGVHRVGKSDSLNSWMHAKAQAAKVSHAAKKLKKTAKKANKLLEKKHDSDLKRRKRKSKAQKRKDHKKHQKLRRKAAKATANAVQTALKHAMRGLPGFAAKAAKRSAEKVVKADKKKKAKAEAAEAIATKKEGQLQKMVDRLGFLRRHIRGIQEKEVKVRLKAKIRARKYAKNVENHVKRARQHFQAMRRLLLEFQKAVKLTAKDKVRIAKLFATLRALRKDIKKSKAKLVKMKTKKHKERRHKRRAKAKMRATRRRVKSHYKKLIATLRRQIAQEKARKLRPDRNGQLRLNALNVKSQMLVVKLSDRMKYIRSLKRKLSKYNARDKVAQKKAKKRKIVLQVAQSAYDHLSKAEKRLEKIVEMNKARDKIKSLKGAGLSFTKKLARDVHNSVTAAIKKSKQKQKKHWKRH